MKRLLTLTKIEWLKLQRLDMYIISGLFLVLVTAFTVLSSKVSIIGSEGEASIPSPSSFFSTSGFFGWLFMVLTVMLSISREYTNNSFRKRLINGYTRDELYTSQFLNIKITWLVLSVLWLAALLLYSALIGQNPVDYISEIDLSMFISTLIGFFVYGVIAAFWISIFRKVVLSIVFYLVWIVVESSVQMFVTMYAIKNGAEKDFINYFLPGRVVEGFISQPWMFEDRSMLIALFLSLVLFMSVPYLRLRKSDF